MHLQASRVAAEGLVGVARGDKSAVVVEVNSETDFVARNEAFQRLVIDIAQVGGMRYLDSCWCS